MIVRFLLSFLAAAVAPVAGAAGPFPETLTVKGAIGEEERDIGGGSAQSMDLVFSVMDPLSGLSLYDELHCAVDVFGLDGEFQVALGSVDPAGNPLDPALFEIGALELEISSCGEPAACSVDPPNLAVCAGGPLLARSDLPAEAYAFRAYSTDLADNADELDGLDSTDFWQRGDIFSGDVTGPGFALVLAAGAVDSGSIDPTEVQRRVADSCAPGSSIAAIGEDGTVTCVVDDEGVHDERRFTMRDVVPADFLFARDWTCPLGSNAISGGAVRVPVLGDTLFATVGSNGPGSASDQWRTEILNLNPEPATYDFWVVCIQPE